jgi:myosin heavy subunit
VTELRSTFTSSKGNMATATVDQKAVRAIENRKLRNRLSQKAYRARQCMRIKELEERLDGNPFESARIKQLEDQNQRLRGQLLSCHKKLESLSLSMKALADAAATSIGLETGTGTCKLPASHPDQDTPPNEESMTVSDFNEENEDPKDDMVQQDISRVPEMNNSAMQAEANYADSSTIAQAVSLPRSQELVYWSGTSTPKSYNFDNLLREGASPFFNGGNSNFAYQSMSPFSQQPLLSYAGMGGTSYSNTVEKAPLLIRGPHGELHKSNSLFSDHIAVVEHFLKQRWASPKSLLKHGEEG